MIHCIGDSHVCVFSGKDKICDDRYLNFQPHRIGPFLAYNLGNPNHSVYMRLFNELRVLDRKNDFVLLSFGEVDIRVHVIAQAKKQGKEIKEIVKEIVENYVSAIDKVSSLGFKTIVYCPPATCNHYNPEAKVSSENYYPHLGKVEERNKATLYFKDFIKNTLDPSILVVDLCDELIKEDLTTRGEYFMDGIHLSQKSMPIILKKFERLGVPYE